MKTKTLTGLPGLKDEDTVTIWRMNHGFKSDFQGKTTKIEFDSRGRPTPLMDMSKSALYFLVYGIYDAPSIGFNKIQDVGNELTDSEFNTRYQAARKLDSATAEAIQHEITELNAVARDQGEIQKKSN